MYALFKESCLYYNELMEDETYRKKISAPLLLLTDKKLFEDEKTSKSNTYINLTNIIHKMNALYESGNEKYHGFHNLLREISVMGFDIDMESNEKTNTDSNILEDQIELILQFIHFKYCNR